MQSRLAAALATTSLAVAFFAPAFAGPIDSSAVPEQAKWIMHLDLEAFRASTLGRTILDELAARPQAAHLQKASDVVGFDLKENLLDVTVYGSDFTRESVAMLVDIAGGTGNLEGLMLAAPGYQSTTVDNRLIHSFIAEDKRRGDAPRMFVAIQPTSGGKDHRLVASYDSEVLHGALDRIEEAKADLTALTTAPAAGSVLFMLIDDIDPSQLANAGEHSAVLQMIRGLSVDLGEQNGRITATAHVSVVDEPKAEQLRQLVQGMMAMAQLGNLSNPGAVAAAELAQRARVTKEGAVVSVRLDAVAEDVATRVRELTSQ